MIECRKELETLSVGLSTLPQMQIAFFEGLTAYVSQFKLLLDGPGLDCVTEDIGGARIRHIFNSVSGECESSIEVFREKMEELEYAKEVPEKGTCILVL